MSSENDVLVLATQEVSSTSSMLYGNVRQFFQPLILICKGLLQLLRRLSVPLLLSLHLFQSADGCSAPNYDLDYKILT